MTVAPIQPPRADWFTDAACGDADPALFDDELTAAGAAYCAGCPVRPDCVADAITHNADGGWGGLSKLQRIRLAHQGWAIGQPLPPVLTVVSDPPAPPARRRRRRPRPAPPAPWPPPDPSLQPRPDQREALEAILADPNTLRGQVHRAPGTGKTLIGRWAAEHGLADLVLVVVPTLELVAQTLREWHRPVGWPFDPIVVCSDPTTVAGAAERGEGGADPFAGPNAGDVPVTTEPRVLARFLEQATPGRARVVLSTYQSAPVVARAVRQANRPVRFDLAVLDEAHRLAGAARAFRAVLDDTRIPVTRRLFLTATPVLIRPGTAGGELLSMDDEATFGPAWHELSFAEAIDQELISDYEVLVVVAREPTGPTRDPATADAIALGAVRAAAAEFGLRRVLSFHGRVAKARRFAAALHRTVLPDGRRVVATHVAGKMPSAVRQAALRRLADTSNRELVVVANARCLGEGVDVPAVDGVLFADPRRSTVDIVQAVGRALRRAPGKRRGLIIVPVALPAGEDDDSALAAGPFAHVWAVLRALRAHDERLAVEIDAALRAAARGGGRDRAGRVGAGRIRFVLPDDVDLDKVQVRLVEEVGAGWERSFGLLERYVETHGTARVPRGYQTSEGVVLGEWAERQRIAHRRGLLNPARAARLAALPGWVWDLPDARWQDNLAALRDYAERRTVSGGELDFDELSGLAAPAAPAVRQARRTLGMWAAAQRVGHRAGRLASWQVQELDAVPGWSWTVLPPADAAMVDALRAFTVREGHANAPYTHLEGGLPLGRWLNDIRRRRLTGRLAAALADELAAVMPAAVAAGGLRWETGQTRWRLHYEALQAFAARTGHTGVPFEHVERLADAEVDLGHWVARQRHQRRAGELDPARAVLVERLPGWRWEVDPSDRVAVNLDDVRCGTREAYWKGHRCPSCTNANLRAELVRQRLRAAGVATTDLVDAGRAAEHLERLLAARGVGATAIARAAGVNVKTVTDVFDGTVRRVHPEIEGRLLAVTLDAVRAAAPPTAHVDGGPTRQLLDQLIAAGWPARWILREIGLWALPRGPQVLAATAAKVAKLHDRIGGRPPTARRRGTALPPLAEIEALWWSEGSPGSLAVDGHRPRMGAALVSAIPASSRLRKLRQLGARPEALAAAAGLPHRKILGIIGGRISELPADQATAILALTSDRISELRATSGGTSPPT
jgi:superfamily II DNA or RNA helicase